jgi:C4-dicarboxylate transporter DctM subunit
VPFGFALVIFRLVQSFLRDLATFVTGVPSTKATSCSTEGGPRMLWQQLQNQTVELGWDFYGPVILFVVLVALAVPVWAAIGAAAILMLVMVGRAAAFAGRREACSHGIDHFALTAVPLFILTGDVLVRTGLSRKFLDVAEALTCWAKGGFGSATVLVCGMFAAISGSDAAGAAAVGRMTIDRLVESGYPRPYACALVAAGACTGILIPPSIAYIIIGLVLGISASTLFLAAVIPGIAILVSILVTNIIMNRI